MLLSRDQILEAKDIETEDIPVPEWGGEVRLRMLTGTERDKFEASMVETKGNKTKQNLANFRARMVAQCIVTEAGEVMFNPRDVDELGKKSAKALGRVFDACQRMNGFSETDVAELTEGFDDAPSEGSTTD